MSREDTAAAKETFDEDLNKLWNIIKNADQETRKKIISGLDEKTTFLLRTRQNPYQKPVYKGNKNKILCFNVINLREKYLQRFAMTSLIGFMYRMLDEFEPLVARITKARTMLSLRRFLTQSKPTLFAKFLRIVIALLLNDCATKLHPAPPRRTRRF